VLIASWRNVNSRSRQAISWWNSSAPSTPDNIQSNSATNCSAQFTTALPQDSLPTSAHSVFPAPRSHSVLLSSAGCAAEGSQHDFCFSIPSGQSRTTSPALPTPLPTVPLSSVVLAIGVTPPSSSTTHGSAPLDTRNIMRVPAHRSVHRSVP